MNLKNILLIQIPKNVFWVQVPVLLFFLGYQISLQYEDSITKSILNISALAIAAGFLLKSRNVKFVGILFCLVFFVGGVLLKDPRMAMLAALMFAYGYCVVVKAEESLNRVLRVMLVANTIIILCQLVGVDAVFYKFQFYDKYSSNEIFSSFLTGEGGGYVPPSQARPSGMFPSTIYLSVFECLIFGQLIASKTYGRKAMKFLTGFTFALTGSVASTMLFLFSLLFLSRRKQLVYFQCGFLLGLMFLFIALFPIYIQNYTPENMLVHFGTRLVDPGEHSVLTANILSFGVVVLLICILILGIGFYLKKRGMFSFFGMLIFLIVCVAPVLIHAILEDIRYWFIIGVACGQLRLGSFQLHPQKIRANKFQTYRKHHTENVTYVGCG